GGVQVHTISTPSSDTTYTAFFNGSAPNTTTTVAVPTTTTSSSSSTTLPTGATTTTTLPPAGSNLMPSATLIAYVTVPGGGGNKDLNVIRDGVKPPVGSDDSLAQYDTYDGTTRTSDWIGATWPTAQVFGRVVFQEGKHFQGGGCF